jgi:hypothetical protein
MMSSMAWACRVLLPTTLHPVSGTSRCRCITRPIVIADRWPMALAAGCSHTVATCLTTLPVQSC